MLIGNSKAAVTASVSCLEAKYTATNRRILNETRQPLLKSIALLLHWVQAEEPHASIINMHYTR